MSFLTLARAKLQDHQGKHEELLRTMKAFKEQK